jgi:putative DNA primase/helicase
MAKMQKVERDYRQELTDKIIEQMEKGTAPWLKPWDPSQSERRLPYNPTTNAMYKGANSIALTIEGRSDPRWMTYKQAGEQGLQVRKGEKGTLIEYWKFNDRQKVLDGQGNPVTDSKGEPITRDVKLDVPRVFRAVVFNGEQIEGMPELKREKLGYQWEPIERAEKILEASGAKILHDQSNRAFYSSATDEIHMPGKQQFPTQAAYYSTALHELGHWTGHESRLDRKLGNTFGSADYAKEELRAELSSYFTAERLGIPHEPGQHAAYVKSWVQALKDDKNEIFKASRDAEKITEYVIGLDQAKEQTVSKGIELGSAVVAQKAVDLAQGAMEKSTPKPELAAGEKVILAVPFKEKEEAKALGAKWDKENKTWYAGPNADLEKLAKFIPKAELVREKVALDPQVEFASALKAAGLQIDGLPVMNGKMQRVQTTDDRSGQTSGAYVGYLDGKPSGFIQNFKTGLKENWTVEGMQLSPEEQAQLQAQAALIKQQRAAEVAETQGKVAEKVGPRFEGLPDTPVTPNKYLERKGVEAFGVKFEGQNVVVPMRDVDGKLWSIQRIPPEVEALKMFEKGGKKMGTMHVIGEIKPGSEILVAEGYSTGASLHQATGKTVAVAFDSGNVGPVVNALQQRYSTNPIFIMADNDRPNANRGNVGVEKALEAAEKYKVGVAFPKFQDPMAKVSDFNDLHKTEGLGEVKKQVEAAISKTLEQSHKEAKALLPNKEIKETLPNGRYTGQVVGSTGYHAAQDIGGKEAVVHQTSKLNQVLTPEKIQTVQYQGGRGQVTDRAKTKQKELER